MNQKQKIVDRLMSNIWLFENIFWKITDNVVYDEQKEKAKLFLDKIYWKKDVREIFPKELDTQKVNQTMDKLFQYYGNNTDNEGNSK